VTRPQHGFAIAGGGVILPWHAAAISALAGAELRAIVDADPARAQARGIEYGVDAYSELDRMLERKDIEVVSICVPSGLHAEVGVRAAEAGKHLVVEKPLEITMEAADRLIAACERSGVRMTVISQHRFQPGIRRLREAVEAGLLGRLIAGEAVIKWYRTQEYYDSAGWRGTWAADGGGCLMNQGIHYVDLLRWILGPVNSVYAICQTAAHEIEVEDLAAALVRFQSGALGTIQASTAVYPGLPERLEVAGTEGTVVVETGRLRVWQLKAEAGETGPYGSKLTALGQLPVEPPGDRTEGHRAQMGELLDAIETGAPLTVTPADARATLELILAIYRSSETGVEVRIPD
jgi:predicted dehydrogenase